MKKAYHSKVVWINFIILVLSLFDSEFFSALGLQEQTIVLISSILVKVVAIGNIALRFLTTQSITIGNKSEATE